MYSHSIRHNALAILIILGEIIMTTPAPKKGGCGRNILMVIGALVLACIVCGVISYAVAGPAIMNVINALAAPITANNDFMTALVNKDYTKAYGMIQPSQQQKFGGSPDGLKQFITDKSMDPSSFTFTNIQITATNTTDALVNDTGVFGGKTQYVYLSLSKDGDTWKISDLQVNDNAPTATPTS
jgi:hypothetical protein